MDNHAAEASKYIQSFLQSAPSVGIVLGSGLGGFVNELNETSCLKYAAIPQFPVSTVAGHKGQLVIGRFLNETILMLQGRFHYYEGYSLQEVVFPIHVLKLLGVKQIVLTNAAGGINRSFSPGNFMLIADHLQLINDKRKRRRPIEAPFFQPQPIYSKDLMRKTEKAAERANIDLKKGVYAAVPGPSYETPAEILMLEKLGADAVGMSTAPEAEFAYEMGLEVVGISCISNMAAGILNEPLSHKDVIATAARTERYFAALMKELLKELIHM